jgi:hypothetical protein
MIHTKKHCSECRLMELVRNLATTTWEVSFNGRSAVNHTVTLSSINEPYA